MKISKLKKLLFFFRKGVRDILNPGRFGVSDQYPKHDEWPYGLDYTTSEFSKRYGVKFDLNEIPMMKYDVKQGENMAGKWYYHPLKVAHYALASYNDYLKGDHASAKPFRANVVHLTETAEEGPRGGAIWRVPRALSRYGTPRGHASAIVQGLAISALCRSYVMDGNESHLELAEEATGVLSVPVEEGGVLSNSRWGPMYEEYPAVPYSHVVNGFVFCLMGLYDLKSISENANAAQLFQEGVQTLKSVIPDWIEARWSKYDLRDVVAEEPKNYATLHYQLLHADQMEVMYRVTDDEYFYSQKKRIKKQSKNKLYLAKVYNQKVKKFIIG